jgi:hypothetical protein
VGQGVSIFFYTFKNCVKISKANNLIPNFICDGSEFVLDTFRDINKSKCLKREVGILRGATVWR